jgi:hypothetical protein
MSNDLFQSPLFRPPTGGNMMVCGDFSDYADFKAKPAIDNGNRNSPGEGV